jgi:hypothetical protein
MKPTNHVQPTNAADDKHPSGKPGYLNERGLAVYLNVSGKWLQKMRLAGGGTRYAKFGARVLYPFNAIAELEAAQTRVSTSDRGGAM